VAVLYAVAPGLGWLGGRVVSFLAAASATWLLNRRFTFAASPSDGGLGAEYLRYLSAMVCGAAINYLVYAAVLWWTPEKPYTAAIGVALGSIAGLAVNFATARRLVFTDRSGRR
ncbi:MAG: GtrA family protein, partial [Comamonadaceae bacterium]